MKIALPSDSRYMVSDDGIVYGLSGRPLRPWIQSGCYYALRIGGRTRLVHDLVLETFVGPKPAGACVRHGPGGSLDNSIDNICYGTYSENNYDMVRDGTHHQSSKTHCPSGHEYTPENTKIYTGRGWTERLCRECQQVHGTASKARIKAQRHARGLKKVGRKPVSHCKHGHEYTPQNTYIKPDGYRDCRECLRRRSLSR